MLIEIEFDKLLEIYIQMGDNECDKTTYRFYAKASR